MKILTYFSSLLVSTFVYFLFATYMTVAAGLNSVLPLVSFSCALIIFGFLSWFHFYKEKTGAIFLTIFISIMFFSWPILLFIEHFTGEDYKPNIWESLIPLILSVLTIFGVWKGKNQKINKYLKIILLIPTSLLALYIGGYFAMYFF